jgi:glucose/arabinose dehydrogenase
VSNLEVPWALSFAPDGRLFVAERPGRVRIVDLSTSASELALTLDDVYRQGEAGLLGLALAPDFAATRHVFLYYTAVAGNAGVNRIVRYREVGGRLAERALILDGIPAGVIHDGGRLRFGPDGLLYATAGDASNSALAQDQASLAGKFLRIERDSTTPRANAFGSPIFSWGHRNPQGFDWHPSTGEIWATEHGNSGNDEINVIRSGVNYGWPTIEGAQTFPNMEPPLTSFSPSIAPSGAAFYQGARFPSFVGNLFAATLRGTHLLRLVVDAPARRVTRQERLLDGTVGRLRDVAIGPDGYIYISTNNRDGRGTAAAGDDRIIRVSPAP